MNPIVANALWAMHPDYLAALLRQGSIEAMLPEMLKKLAAFGAPAEAQGPPDPIRQGATAILPIKGVLGPSGMVYGGGQTDVLANRIRELGADPKVGAVVLDIRSPGGLVFGTAELGDAIFETRQAKPIVAVADPYAFSAAHWIATQASEFFASTSGEVGSVGVRSGHVDQSGLEEKLGLKTTLVASHPDKIAGHPYAPLSEADLAEIQKGVDEANAAFTAAIARGRGIAKEDVAAIHGTGKTFSAQRAAAAGITDGVMTLRDTVAKYSSSRSRLALMRRRAEVEVAASDI